MAREVATQQHQPKTFPALLEEHKADIATVLPEGMNIDRVCRMALSAYRMDDKIRNCTPVSILQSVMKSLELGLEIGALKHAYLIPYGKECTFQPSYMGLLELARRSGDFRVIDCRCVYENDVFELTYDPRPIMNHRPNLMNPGAEVGAYAYAVLKSGETVIEWMNRGQIEEVRAKAKGGPAWRDWWGEMARKTPLKRMLKRLPKSVQLADAIAHDDAVAGLAEAVATVGTRAEGSRAAALALRLEGPDAGGYVDEEPAAREPGSDG